MFFRKKKQKADVQDYREFLSTPENQAAVHNISQHLLAEVAPQEAEITAGFIDGLIEMASGGKTITADSASDEAGGFGGADLMVVVVVQVAIFALHKLLTQSGEANVEEFKRRLQHEENPETFIRIETGDVKVAITSTQSSQGKRKVRQIVEAVNLILSAYLLEDIDIEIKDLQKEYVEGTSTMTKTNLSHDDRQKLSGELNKLLQWRTGGVPGARAVLSMAGLPQNTVYDFSLTGVPSTDATTVITSLENFGRLIDRPTHTALGALVEYLLNKVPDQEGQNFLAGLIVRYRMIDDENYLAKLHQLHSLPELPPPPRLKTRLNQKIL